MNILGLNGGLRLGYQDVSAVLLQNGAVVSAIEEERISRIKHSPGQLPEKSIQYVLEQANLSMNEVDVVAFHGATWGTEFESLLKEYLSFRFGFSPTIQRVHHHDAHAASAYYGSGFDEAMVLTADSSGDGISLQLMTGRGGNLTLESRSERPQSLGLFYSMITQWCGFSRDRDEYKLMGLASYGKEDQAFDLSFLIKPSGHFFDLDLSYIKSIEAGQPQPTRQQPLFNQKFIEKLGAARSINQPIEPIHHQVAKGAQLKLEECLVHIVTEFHKRTGIRKLCLAGGVALNCVANQKLMNLDFIDEVFVQPASSDAGISLGAAQWVSTQRGAKPQPTQTCYWGKEYSNQQITETFDLLGLCYTALEDPAKEAVKRITTGEVLGWFQGGSEFGPRALGHRSILADPRRAEMKDLINSKIKFREGFRPFCPSVLEEDVHKLFIGKASQSPFMNITYDVKEEYKTVLPAVTHVDGTARVQTVNSHQDRLYYELLQEMKRQTGYGVCLNTSFNLSYEPIVETPQQAMATFFGSGMDSCIVGHFLVQKK